MSLITVRLISENTVSQKTHRGSARLRVLSVTCAIATLLTAGLAAAQPPKTMKAIQYRAFGPTSVLEFVDVPTPTPGPGQVLVRVQAAGVNSLDWGNRSGVYKFPAANLPVIPGHDLAGTVVEWGAGVANRRAGEQVYAMLPLNTHRGADAEFIVVDNAIVVDSPKNLDATAAAAVPLAALTAYQALFDKGRLQPGQTVLIHGASGGVGHFAVQLAKNAGAKVIGTSSAANLDFLKKLGADTVIDYRAQRFEDVAGSVDLVFDTVGGDTLKRSYDIVGRGGAIVTIADKLDRDELARRGIRGEALLVAPNAVELASIARLIESGAVKPEVSAVFALQDATKAQDQNETGHTRGKVVLRVAAAERSP